MLTQMDITTDGFGYMLSFGDLVWVPFTYGIQARYLAFHPVDLGLPASAAIVALNVIGFYIFRTANSDKDSFRKHGNPKSECATVRIWSVNGTDMVQTLTLSRLNEEQS